MDGYTSRYPTKIIVSILGLVLLGSLIGLLVFVLLFSPVRSSEPGVESEATGNPGGAEGVMDDDEELARGILFVVEFSTPTGETLILGPCCGATETEMPSRSEFPFTVVKIGEDAYRVKDLPIYTP